MVQKNPTNLAVTGCTTILLYAEAVWEITFDFAPMIEPSLLVMARLLLSGMSGYVGQVGINIP